MAFLNSSKTFSGIFCKRFCPDGPLRDGSSEGLSSLAKIFHLGAVGSGPVEGGFSYFIVCKRYAEPGPETA